MVIYGKPLTCGRRHAHAEDVNQHGGWRNDMRDQDFRDLMAAVCAPVTVVTTVDEDGPRGPTVSPFAPLSLPPPLVTVALDQHSALLARIQQTGRLGVNVLGSGAHGLAPRVASR